MLSLGKMTRNRSTGHDLRTDEPVVRLPSPRDGLAELIGYLEKP